MDTRRVCCPGWNAAYRLPGISHFFLHSTSNTRGTLSLFLESRAGGTGRGGKHPSQPLSACASLSINQVGLCSSLVKYGHSKSFQQCAPRNAPYLISLLEFLFPSPANQGWGSPPGSQPAMSWDSTSRVPVGFAGAFPESADPGPLLSIGCSRWFLSVK